MIFNLWSFIVNICWDILIWAILWLRPFVTSLLSWRCGLNPKAVHVGFVVVEVTLEQVFLRVLEVFTCQHYFTSTPYAFISWEYLRFSLVSIIPPVLHMHSFTDHPCCIILAVVNMIKQCTGKKFNLQI
jgi:hypothetical protein